MGDVQARDKRVAEFVEAKFGPQNPKRSYITREEAEALMLAGPWKCVFNDLDIKGYHTRWKQSIEDSIREGLDCETWAFWISARQSFLEYGGCYKAGYEPKKAS